MKSSTLALAAGLAFAAAGAHAAPRGFTVDDLVRMERVSSAAVSPDGARVVYAVRSTDIEKNRGVFQLWTQDLRAPNAQPVQLTRGAGSSTAPAWSPSGDALYFLSAQSGSMQLYRMPAAGGPAVQVSDLPVDIDNFRVSPKGDRVAFSAAVFRDCPDLACTKARRAEKAGVKATGRVYDQLFIRHWDTWTDGTRNVLFSAPLGADGRLGGAVANLSGSLEADVSSKPTGDESDYAFSPDGQSIVFSARVGGKTESWSTNFDLFQVNAAGGAAPRNLTADNLAWDAHPVFSPDGRTLAYTAMDRPGFEADRFHLVLVDVATGKKRTLAGDWDRSVADFEWTKDGRTIVAEAQDIGQVRLFAIDAASGKVAPLTGKGAVTEFAVGADSIVYAQANLSSGAQLYRMPLAGGAATQLTHVNETALADVRFGEPEQFSFKGARGETVYGYVVKPWNAQPGQKYPIAFLVHGGPQSSFNNNWSYRWNAQTYAGAGYAVVMVDFHGSSGYGQKFTDAISQNWGSYPLEDLKKGLAAAVAKYGFLDRSKACALGASYGGYMMNWIQGNWSDGFRCIVNHAGVFDQRGMAYGTEELWFTEWENGGTYYDQPAKYEKFNPVNFVRNWKTPMLVTQGERDYRIPYIQSISAFTALQRRGIESKLVMFADENHHILKPANSIMWHREVLSWLDAHLKK
jgi:dipeptidyl aminopeptidase/acylaminoacyl peptidase